MPYTSKWEQLSEATARVMAARGLSEAEARAEICSAMADGVINFRAKLLEHWSKPISSGAVLGREGFEMMNEIHPEDFDWRESRPIKPWIVRQGRHNPSGLWKLKWIELAKADVTNAFCLPGWQSEVPQHASIEPGAATRSHPAPASGGPSVGADLRSIARPQSAAARQARRTGRRPVQTPRVMDAMRNDIREGRRSAQDLENMTQEELARCYGASREIVNNARNAVLSEIGGN